MSSHKMLEKGVATIKGSFSCKGISGAEATHHGFLEVAEGMPNPVIRSGEALGMVLAVSNWAFLGPLRLMSK